MEMNGSAAAGFRLRRVGGVVGQEGLDVLDLLGLDEGIDPFGALLVLAGGEVGLPLGLGFGMEHILSERGEWGQGNAIPGNGRSLDPGIRRSLEGSACGWISPLRMIR